MLYQVFQQFATMQTWILLILVSLSVVVNSLPIRIPTPSDDDQILLVVSFDSFHEDYLQRGLTTNLLKFREDGVYSKYVENVFPTKTFVNHFTIATGLYAENHGVTGNSLFDKKLGYLNYSSDLFHFNKDVLPIWTLNEMAGQKSGCIMWPGCDYTYNGYNISHLINYNHKLTYEERIDIAIKWINSPTDPVKLMMIYFEDPDYMGHAFSPESTKVRDMIVRADNLTNYLKNELHKASLLSRVNIIILSDHGMSSVTPRYLIDIGKYADSSTYDLYMGSPFLQLVPKKIEDLETIYTNLSRASESNGHFKVYKNDELLERWHIRNEQRTGPISLLADLGYAFQDMWNLINWYKKEFNITVTEDTKFGIHGYDNLFPSMYPIFMAQGPKFKKQHSIKFSKTIDYYELFCELLNLTPLPNNGSLSNIIEILEENPYKDMSQGNILTILGIVFTVFLVFAAIGVGITIHHKRTRSIRTETIKEIGDPLTFYSNLDDSEGSMN